MENLLLELIILACIVTFAFLVKRFLKNKSERAANTPFAVIAVLLLAMEAAKQIYSLSVGYDLYYIPLQICSLFMICYPIAAFCKGKLQAYGQCMSLCLGCSASFAQIFLSQILTRDYIFKLFTPEAVPFHYFTVAYHHLIVLNFVLMIVLRPYKPNKRDIIPTVIFYAVFMVISCIFANVLHTNYSGYINYGASVFDYFKRYGQFVFNIVGFCLNTMEYLLGVLICFSVNSLITRRKLRMG
ncbi:hypothetical protein FACS1894219_03910 [Clostridia bacterium]|nr:hypothetical protein FACS1894219_03910 [Clostridia bacterium]